MPHERDLIQEQIDYYRRKAPEYDASAAQGDDPLVAHGREIDRALDAFRPAGRVLEIACGTGNQTRRLLEHASELTAVDSSSEAMELARKKLGDDPRIRFIEADIFSWNPEERYDVVFFGWWLCHVPPERFDRFWDLVRRALKPGGRVFFEDEFENAFNDEFIAAQSLPLVRRTTSDGSTYRVVKVFWDPAELETRLRGLGWDIEIHTTGPFYWGEGHRSSPG
ncbi:MAG: class I SAM-dependent methyltransferase [Actinomycetota bacterium]